METQQTKEQLPILELHNIHEDDIMKEDELIDMYGDCSDLIHARNPLKGDLDYTPYLDKFLIWGKKITTLLSTHCVTLADGKHILIGIMNPVDTPYIPRVGIYTFDTTINAFKRIHDRPE